MRYIFLAFALSSFTGLNAQLISQTDLAMPGYTIYAELYGASHGVTLNYDRVAFRFFNRWNGSIRIGFGTYAKEEGRLQFISAPAGVNLFAGRNGHNKEIGIHFSYVKGESNRTIGSLLKYSEGLYLSPAIGYRYQKEGGSFVFRIQYSPFVKLKEYSKGSDRLSTGKLTHSFGISAGYYFSRQR
jgi:hypothetical protein